MPRLHASRTLEPHSGSPTPEQRTPPSRAGSHSPERLRRTALRLDRLHGIIEEADVERAILLWQNLLSGRWVVVDWFDAEGRRFIIAKLSVDKRGSVTGLTKRERQVVLSAALGESGKVTGHRLGVGPSRVSALLKGAMRKLGVRTKAQLIVMVRLFHSQDESITIARSEETLQNG